MTEIEVINERLQRGDERFAEVTDALSRITTHLQSQDATMAEFGGKLDQVVRGTEDVISMWKGGVTAVRFFCRIAEAWRFLMRQVVLPFGLPIIGIYGIWFVHAHGQLPSWLVATFKFINAAL